MRAFKIGHFCAWTMLAVVLMASRCGSQTHEESSTSSTPSEESSETSDGSMSEEVIENDSLYQTEPSETIQEEDMDIPQSEDESGSSDESSEGEDTEL